MAGDEIAVEFAVPCAVAQAWLADPRNRPAWQSSLRAVADVVPGQDGGAGTAGATWTDVTVVPALRPRMRAEHSSPGRWVETGEWGPFRARLELFFAPAGAGCVVTARFRVRGLGIGRLVTLTSIPAIRSDLRRASRLAVRG